MKIHKISSKRQKKKKAKKKKEFYDVCTQVVFSKACFCLSKISPIKMNVQQSSPELSQQSNQLEIFFVALNFKWSKNNKMMCKMCSCLPTKKSHDQIHVKGCEVWDLSNFNLLFGHIMTSGQKKEKLRSQKPINYQEVEKKKINTICFLRFSLCCVTWMCFRD